MLQLTLKDGSTVTFPFGEDSSLSVWTPDGVNGEKRGSWGEITGLELVPDADPAPVDATAGLVAASATIAPNLGGITVPDPPVTSAPEQPEESVSVPAEDSPPVDETAPAPESQPVDANGDPIPVPTDAPDPNVPDPATTEDATADPVVADPEHDTAVAEANDAIVQVALGSSDPDALAKALADVEAALATYPDSPELADAKTQLTELTASATSPEAA